MTASEILKKLARLGSPGIKKTLMRHGAKEPLFGVKIEDLKKIQKTIKSDYALSLQLYDTGNSDAMYLAGLEISYSAACAAPFFAKAAHFPDLFNIGLGVRDFAGGVAQCRQ